MPTPTVVLLLLACASWYGTCPCPARCARSCLLACRARASSCRHLARLPLLFEFVRRCRPAVRVSRRCWLRAALCGCAEDSGVALLCASGLKNIPLRPFSSPAGAVTLVTSTNTPNSNRSVRVVPPGVSALGPRRGLQPAHRRQLSTGLSGRGSRRRRRPCRDRCHENQV